MKKTSKSETRHGFWMSLVAIGMIAALIWLPSYFRSEAGSDRKNGLNRTVSNPEGMEKMYDIREDKSIEAQEAIASFRNVAGFSADLIEVKRKKFIDGEELLKSRIPTAKVEYNTDIRIPEVITPDVWKSEITWLSEPSSQKRSEILRNFVKQNNSLIGVTEDQADQLKVSADYTNPDGNMSYAHLDQVINGVPVFRAEVKAGFRKNGQIVRVINNLAPNLDYESLSKEFGDPAEAVRNAFKHVTRPMKAEDQQMNAAESNDLRVKFGTGDWATTAEKMYFPTEPGVARAAWRVLVWEPVAAYYVIVDAETGMQLWRKNIVDDQTTARTYQIYGNANAYTDIADSPAPLTPGPIDPALGTQGALLNRTTRTLIGNEGTLSFNNNGWITDGQDRTDGNAVEAGIDRDGTNGVDPASIVVGSPANNYDSTWNPPPGSPAPGDEPLTAQAQRGAVIQMFYAMNRYHDELYKRGFTEQARNFQGLNFGRGGVENDRVSAEGQDSSGTNNANFATPADGGRGRMQMFLWTGPTPDKDGTTDIDVVIHEVTHGTSNRLHNNGAGLGNQGGMMGEGWSDWYAHVMLAEPTDPINGIYTTGGYATHLLGGFTANYYYGIRRFPKAVIAFTGGPNNRPHNPLTFGHLNAGCDTTLGTTTTAVSSAFPRSPVIATAGNCSQVHNAGEIWSSALWEVRALMVQRLGFAAGTTRVLQVVTDGMKLAPTNPMMLQERDAIIAAAAALPAAPEASADVADVREGFRKRGFGFSAQTISSTAVVEAFDFPNVAMTNPFSVSDAPGDNDGFPEPGENVLLSVAVINQTGAAINNVVANVNGGTNVSYGNMADGTTVTRQIPYTVPAGAACGSFHDVTINVSSAAGAQTPQIRSFRLGAPAGGAPIVASNNTALTLPDGTGAAPAPASTYPSNVTVAGAQVFTNAKVTMTINNYTHTFPGDNDFLLVGPAGQKFSVVSDQGGGGDIVNVSISLNDGAAAALPGTLTAGTFRPTADASADIYPAPAPAAPYENPAPGGAATFNSVFGGTGSGLNGTWSLYVVDDAGGDTGTISGWSLTVESNDFVCSIAPTTKSRADFDGDGRTDVSVFRGSEGNWYLNRSTAGFTASTFGTNGDQIVPCDYDGDNKADLAVFRPNATATNPDYWVLNSGTSTLSGASWGTTGDKPVIGDFDGDNKCDFTVYRSSNTTWYTLTQTGANTIINVGAGSPLAEDFDGDGKSDITMFNNGAWTIRNSGGATTNVTLGQAGDLPVAADYNGDNKADVAVFRNGSWIINLSTGGQQTVPFGTTGDVPVPGDYDGDGKDDVGVYRGGTWFMNRSTSGVAIQAFGIGTDSPAPRAWVP